MCTIKQSGKFTILKGNKNKAKLTVEQLLRGSKRWLGYKGHQRVVVDQMLLIILMPHSADKVSAQRGEGGLEKC